MNRQIAQQAALLITLLAATTACTDDARQEMAQAAKEASAEIQEATAEGGKVAQELAEAREKLQTESLKLDAGGTLPQAEITVDGELLISGTAVALDDAQRTALRNYRSEVIAVASAGMDMGEQGAAIAGQAVTQAISGALGGKDASESATASIEAKANEIRIAALELCRRAEVLESSQATLAALIPEFAPYAKTIDAHVNCDDVPPTAPEAPVAPEPPTEPTAPVKD